MTDPFAVFGLPRRFEIDAPDLQSRYLQMARLVHPDFAGADPASQASAMQRAAQLNEAWRILSDPLERAACLLRLLSPGQPNDPAPDPDFLEQVLDWRQRLSDARAAGNAPALLALEHELAAQRQTHLAQLTSAFAADPPQLNQAQQHLAALRYLDRILRQIDME